MTELASLLELLYRASGRWRTARLRVHDWTHLERSHLAFEHHLARTKGIRGPSVAAGTYGDGPGKHPRELAWAARIWVGEGGRFREEREGEDLTMVSDGKRTVVYSAATGAIEHEADGMGSCAGALLDPAVLIPSLELVPGGETVALGRAAVAVHATPRPRVVPPPDLVPYGCDEVTLLVDRASGVVLRVEARFRGDPVRVLEVTELALDEELGDGVFVLELPEGETVRAASDAYAHRTVTLEAAARDAGFTVWAPPTLPGRWHAHVIHRPAGERPQLPETVTILFTDTESLHHFGLEQAAERLLAWRVGNERVVERDGVELRLVGGDALPGPPLEVHLERDGTHIRVYSDNLDEASLVDVAASLRPAPTTLPPTTAPA